MRCLLALFFVLTAMPVYAGPFIPINYISLQGAQGEKGETGAFTNTLTETLDFDSNTAINIGPVYGDMLLITSARAGASSPSYEANANGVYMWRMDGTADELMGITQMPHSWDKRTIYPHIHWEPRAAGTVSCSVTMNWIAMNPADGSLEDSGTCVGSILGTYNVGYGYSTNVTPITLTNPSISTNIAMRLKITPFTAGTGIWIWGWDIHYGSNKLGTRGVNNEP